MFGKFKSQKSKKTISDPKAEEAKRAAHDLLIIGAGTLGSIVTQIWKRNYPKSAIDAETKSNSSHARLKEIGAVPRLRRGAQPEKHAFVLFCAPPSASEDYEGEARRAVELWDGRGRLVFTSSTAVYEETDGRMCTELSKINDSDRAKVLLAAEKKILSAGGCVVRLAGLYNLETGPHRTYLRTQSTPVRPEGYVNLIHYNDAGSLCFHALEYGSSGAVYIGCDDKAMTRQEMTNAISASSITGAAQVCRFTGKEGPLGNRYDNTFSRRMLKWEPKWGSFTQWIASL